MQRRRENLRKIGLHENEIYKSEFLYFQLIKNRWDVFFVKYIIHIQRYYGRNETFFLENM